MKHLNFYTFLLLFIYSSIAGMDLSYTFITNEKPPQNIIIPLELALQSNFIKTMMENIDSKEIPQLPINASTEVTVNFISYLKKIKYPCANNVFSQHLHTLNNSELINLTQLIDEYDVVDKNNHQFLAKELALKIYNTPIDNIDCFKSLNHAALFRSALRHVNILENFDLKIIDPYVNTLQKKIYIPETEFIENNATLFKPYYINLTTGIIIKGAIYRNNNINSIIITNFNDNDQLDVVSTSHLKISEIKDIKANATETIFIFTIAHDKHLIINLNNPTKPISDYYRLCAFTKKNEQLYVIKEKDNNFGILDMTTNIFTPIKLPHLFLPIQQMSTNKDKTIIALSSDSQILIGKKRNKKSNSFIFKSVHINSIDYQKDITRWEKIINICLHPHEKKMYLEVEKNSYRTFCIVDIPSFKIITARHSNIPIMYRDQHEIFFIADDILFLGYATGPDYFFNIRTGNYWSKDKERFHCRIALTADSKHSIEGVTKYENSSKPKKTIEIVPIIDDHIIKTVELFNKGYYSLPVLTIARSPRVVPLSAEDRACYENLNESIKTVISASHTITDL